MQMVVRVKGENEWRSRHECFPPLTCSVWAVQQSVARGGLLAQRFIEAFELLGAPEQRVRRRGRVGSSSEHSAPLLRHQMSEQGCAIGKHRWWFGLFALGARRLALGALWRFDDDGSHREGEQEKRALGVKGLASWDKIFLPRVSRIGKDAPRKHKASRGRVHCPRARNDLQSLEQIERVLCF
jgi:hypothetical protein